MTVTVTRINPPIITLRGDIIADDRTYQDQTLVITRETPGQDPHTNIHNIKDASSILGRVNGNVIVYGGKKNVGLCSAIVRGSNCIPTFFSSNRRSITLSISANGYPTPTYNGTRFTGRMSGLANNFGEVAEIYYTVNGKDPSRTRSYLYTGQTELLGNSSGSDNTILKARTYYNGKASEVVTFEFRVAIW